MTADLEVVVLSLLLSFQVESSQSSKVLLANRLVHRGTAANTLAVVVSRVRPPISFRLDVAQDHVLNGCRKSRHLPRNVGLPAAPRFTQVLENRPRFVLLDAFRHHVKNVMHHLDTRHPASVSITTTHVHSTDHALLLSVKTYPNTTATYSDIAGYCFSRFTLSFSSTCYWPAAYTVWVPD